MRILRWLLILAGLFLLLMSVVSAFSLVNPKPYNDPLSEILVVMSPYFLLSLLYVIFTRSNEDSWLSLEIQARKAKLRQRIRERDASSG